MILVTGSAGFIGKNVCLYLLKQNQKVIGIDNYITGSSKELDTLKANPNFTFIEASIEKENIKDILKSYRFEKVFHLACPTGVPNLEIIPIEMLTTLSYGTKNILDVALTNQARFFLSSSSEVYGDPNVFPQTEEYTGNVDPVGIRSPYEEGKRFSEALTMAYVRKYHLDARIVRIFNAYGHHFSEKDTRIIPSFISKAVKEEDLVIFGKGYHKRTFVYIDDVINAFMTVMDKGIMGGVYNIGTPKQYTITEVAKVVIEITRSKSRVIINNEKSLHDIKGRLPSTEKLEKLGWQGKVSLAEGIQKIVDIMNCQLVTV